MKLIGLSGPQGGGKSTLLNGLKDLGVFVDDFKVSRQVQERLKLESLERVYDTPQSMVYFQETVLAVKAEREELNLQRADTDVVLTERTFADIAAYAQLWSWKLVDAGKWSLREALDFSTPFTARCVKQQEKFYGNLVLPFMSSVAWENDRRRADRSDVPFISDTLDRFFEMQRSTKVFRITEPSVDGRIKQVHDWLETL